MKCPVCGKELEIQKKQVGVDDNKQPIMNEFAICRDCKKKWNLDKQRAKKAQSASSETAKSQAAASANIPSKGSAAAKKSQEMTTSTKSSPAKTAPAKSTPDKTTSEKTASAGSQTATKKLNTSDQSTQALPTVKTAPKKAAPQKPANEHPVHKKKKKQPQEFSEDSHRANPAKSSKPDSKRAKSQPAEQSSRKAKSQPVKKTSKRKAAKPVKKSRFKILRIILGVLSVGAGIFFFLHAGMEGLSDLANHKFMTNGTVYVILALCLLVAGLISVVMKNIKNIIAFILPILFYIGSAVYTFTQMGKDTYLKYGAITVGAFALIFIVLMLIASSLDNKAHQALEEDYEHDDDYEDDDYYD